MTESEPSYQVSVERVSDVERKLAVEIPWDQVKGRLDEAYGELSRGVTIKGFRRGKVPRRMLEQMFGQHVNKEVAERLVRESMAKALTDNELAPLSEPEVDQEDISDGKEFKYSAVLQVVPEVEPKDYFDQEVVQRPPKVTDEQVDAALAAKQREFTEFRPIEGRNTEDSDTVLVDIMGKVDGQPLDLQNRLVELGQGADEPLPGLAEKLKDIKPEEQDLELALEIPDPQEQGKVRTAQLLVSVKDVKEKVVPELDDEFAKDTGEGETLEELKEKLRKDLLEADERRAREEAKERLVAKLLEHNEVPPVPALVDRQLEQMVRMQQILFGGEQAEGELKEQMRAEAEKVVRSALLVGAIAKKENVEVHDADVEMKIAEMASARQQNVAKLRSEYEKQGRLEQVRSSIREEKTLDLLISKSNIIVRELTEEEASPGREEASAPEADQASPVE